MLIESIGNETSCQFFRQANPNNSFIHPKQECRQNKDIDANFGEDIQKT